ncbi:MAG: PD40 domain-containing protein, partial [Saprospiraceae bacterium]|nr:PD40 domain-containing protein [Saprospiraceae bacterium]
GQQLVYSMAGSLWRQEIASHTAWQLTDGDGYDYQPDWSPDGRTILFVRYDGQSMELMLFNLASGQVTPLTTSGAVNTEPKWAPDGHTIAFVSTQGSGHFLLHKASVENGKLVDVATLVPDRVSAVKRYYYSEYDHAINPTWSPDGRRITFVSNREVAHGTGNIVSLDLDHPEEITTIHEEETAWKTTPDISPDGSRMVYSSYLGRNWQQLWLLPAAGGYPIQITYGDYDNTAPKWSPDGQHIAYISNRSGNTSLWILDSYAGKEMPVVATDLHYLKPRKEVVIRTIDATGATVPARVSILDRREKFYAPREAWIHGDDSRYPASQQFETHYFHSTGTAQVSVPEEGYLTVIAQKGPGFKITKRSVDALPDTLTLTLERWDMPPSFGKWWSGDLHVHMNYTGSYRNTPDILREQARAEDVDFIYNLIVNKEQRIPDIDYYTPPKGTRVEKDIMILQGQEYHTSFWGHLGLLNLTEHYLIPDYVGYPYTAVESIFPHNSYVADVVHQQKGLVGYVHPFYDFQLFPRQSETLTNALPIDAALGNVDYYEVVGFAHHKASAAVWYMLLNCGLRIPAGAGTDAMANYASLRGPVGLNRVYVEQNGDFTSDHVI